MKLKSRIGKKTNSPTGCPDLDKIKTEEERTNFCLYHCPYASEECVLKSKDDDLIERRTLPVIREIPLICSNCGAMETGTLVDGRLDPMSRWQQREGKIWHLKTCGVAK